MESFSRDFLGAFLLTKGLRNMMQKYVWVTLIWLIMGANLFAQEAHIDSLNQTAYKRYRENAQEAKQLAYKALYMAERQNLGPQTVDSYINLGRCFRQLGMWDSAYWYLEEAQKKGKVIRYSKGMMNATNNLGICYLYQGKDAQAAVWFRETFGIAQELGDAKGQGNALNNLFLIVKQEKKYDSAFLLIDQAIPLYLEMGDSVNMAASLANKALLLAEIQKYDSAIHYNYRALRIQETLDLAYAQGTTLNQIAAIYTEKEQFEEALKLHFQALEFIKETGNIFQLASTHTQIGTLLQVMKRYDESFEYLQKSLDYARQTTDPFMIGCSLVDFGNWYIAQEKELPFAKSLLEESIGPLKEANTFNLAVAYDKLGELTEKQGRLRDANDYYEEALKTAKGYMYLRGEYAALEGLASVSEKQGNTQQALVYQKQFQLISDSLINTESIETINRLNIEFETQKKEKENLQLEYDLSQSELEATQQRALRNQLLGIGGILLLLGAGAFIWYRYRQRIAMREQEIELERERAMQEQRRKEAEKLRELDAMKTRFFTNISHEFRTPLTLILGQNEQVQEALDDNTLINRLEVSRRNGHRLLDLVNQVLDVAKLEAGGMTLERQQLDAIPFLKHMLYSFESMAEEKEVLLEFSSSLPQLNTAFDTHKIERIIFNLLSNAMKFTPSSGQVSMRITEEENQLSIHISDSGVGIKASQLPYIFDRFYQADSSDNQAQPGTGIGLSLVKELVELHEGSIDVSSELGKGTTFSILLPIPADWANYPKQASAPQLDPAALPEKQLAVQSPAPSKQPTHSEQILLIEDNPDVRAFVKEQILSFGYKVHEAENGREGLEKAKEIIPDLIISDIMMPELDGYGVAKGLKEDTRTSHIPLILLTSKASDESKIEGLELGIDDYLLKPFNSRELKVRMQNLINQRKRLRQRFSTATVIRPNEVSADSMDQIFLKKVLDTIEANLADEAFSIEVLSEAVGLSSNHLNRKLGALIDQTAGKLIKSMRLQRASDLIKQQAGSITEIAYDTGFSSPADFSRSFKKQFGITPSAFQKQHSAS